MFGLDSSTALLVAVVPVIASIVGSAFAYVAKKGADEASAANHANEIALGGQSELIKALQNELGAQRSRHGEDIGQLREQHEAAVERLRSEIRRCESDKAKLAERVAEALERIADLEDRL